MPAPDELRVYVDAAVKQRDNYLLLYLVLAAVISFLGGWLGAYVTQKGKNVATKEDIGQITTEVESVKTEFAGHLESLKADITTRTYYSQIRYQRETEVYKDIWEKAYAFE